MNMTKFQEALSIYDREFGKLGISYDRVLLQKVAKSCGPAIYRADSAKVASSDKKELYRVKKSFLIKKLGLKDTPKLDDAIAEVVAVFGTGNRNKYRAMFYYLLVKKFRKGSIYCDITAKKKESTNLSQFYSKIVMEDKGLLKRLAK